MGFCFTSCFFVVDFQVFDGFCSGLLLDLFGNGIGFAGEEQKESKRRVEEVSA